MNRVRIAAGGAVWAAAYNLMWIGAWLGLMRREWTRAAAASGHAMPWSSAFWAVWVPLTLPFGFAIAAYLADKMAPDRNPLKHVIAASVVVWTLETAGMFVAVRFPARVTVLDSIVNLAAISLASVLAGWTLGRRTHSSRSCG